MLEGLCCKFMMLRLIIEMFIFGIGIVAAIRLHVWLSSNWEVGIFTQQKLSRMIAVTRTLISSLR